MGQPNFRTKLAAKIGIQAMHKAWTTQLAIVASVALLSCPSPGTAAELRPNVLFIVVDDLRPELGCYGGSHIHSPNIDRFAASGRLFKRAYCQQAVCNPSRTSLMTGMRPDSIGVTGNHSHFRTEHPEVLTLPQHFMKHGYHLGEQGLWGKTTNFELDTRVPLIVRAPGMKAAGKSSSSLVELVDLYPTLSELAGLPIGKQLEGKSFAPILTDPDHVTKTAALSQYPRGGGLMGYSMRTATHRLTRWVHWQTGEMRATELYDYSNGLVESKNIASALPEVVEKLSAQLAALAGLDEVEAVEDSSDERRSVVTSSTVSFEKVKTGRFDKLETKIGMWTPSDGRTIIDDKHAKTGKQCLQLTGGESTSVILEIADGVNTTGDLTFWAERWTKRVPFSFRVEKNSGDGWKQIFDGDNEVRVGRAFLAHIKVPLDDDGIKQLRFICMSPPNTGILIDDIRIAPARAQEIVRVEVVPLVLPALVGNKACPLLKLEIEMKGSKKPISLTGLRAEFDGATDRSDVAEILIYHDETSKGSRSGAKQAEEFVFRENSIKLSEGTNTVWISCRLSTNANIDRRVGLACTQVTFSNGKSIKVNSGPSTQRLGVAVRNGGDDGVHTYRIPGLATTNKGTLIGVYDVRRDRGGDLPGNIDVGMSRSIDGGRSWEPMKVIMDMGDEGTSSLQVRDRGTNSS